MAERNSKTSSTTGKTAPPPAKVEANRLLSPFEEMERLFEGVWPRGWMQPWHWDRQFLSELARLDLRLPKVDIIERDGEVVVKAEVPGVAKDDLDVSVTENAVTIKGVTSHEEKEEKGDYYRSEMRRGAFSRTVGLPCNVDGNQAKAQFKDGVLELTLPKLEKTKRVSVKVG
jgi:HSP20 family protein